MTTRRLVRICLKEPLNDPNDRGVMPMSTVIASHQWLIEASWDGAVLGDPQVFRNTNVGPTGAPLEDQDGLPLAPAWVWWNGVPRDMVKSYRFEDADRIKPMTTKNAEPQSKPVEARARGAA